MVTTIVYKHKLYQIKDKVKATKVMVLERIDGSMAIIHKNLDLKFAEITSRPKKNKGSQIHLF